MLSVREIHRHLLAGKPVVAIYWRHGTKHQGRIIRARTRQGVLEGLLLGPGTWARLLDVWRTT